MRHFLLPGSVTALPFSMRMTTAPAGLIAAAGSTHRVLAGLFSTLRGAVAMAAITRAADEYRRATAGAEIASSWKGHWHTRPMGSSRERPLCGILRVQRRPSGLRGATTELAWRLGAPAFPPAGQRSTASVIPAPLSGHPFRIIPAALRLPDDALLRNPSAGSPSGRKP